MAIEALPQTTVHLLGSAQALTTPTSLVKELIENSIDAHATSIDILISPNTLDKIDVRDNGHGIAAEDLDHLGRRGHTSKLRTFEDLKSIGGVSLGFRGEALASAVQLGDVSVTTRTDGEPVANSVKIKAPGGIASQSRCSHPVGTTVSVANFMFKIPVRKQVFVKEATKTLAKIKELLQAYSLARPNLRFSLKVTKGGKGSWSFAPRPNNGIREAVAQVINRDLAVICIEKYLAFSRHQNSSRYGVETGDSQENLSEKFEVEVFLPKSGIDVSKIGFGQFISIDSRPVAHDKGTMRKIVTLFKYYVKGIGSDDFQRLKNPFLRMNIKCPRESYDPNVEPAKDDVLFENESYILETIERLFKDVYGDPKLASPTIVSRTPLHNADDFELLLARTPAANHDPAFEPRSFDGSEAQNQHLLPVCEMTPDATAGKEQETTIAGLNDEREPEMRSSTQRRWNMSKGYSEDVEEDSQRKPIQWDRGSTSAPSPCSEPFATLNPWLIAKMNRPVRETDTTAQSNLPGPKNNTNIHIANDTGLLPTPQNSSSPMAAGPGLREPPMQTFQARQARLEEDIRARSIANVFQVLEQRQNMPRGDSLIDQAPAKRRRSVDDDQDRESMFRVHRRSQSAQSDADMLLVGDDSEIFIRPNDFISARLAPPPDSSMVSAAPRLRKQRVLNKPFVSPLRTVENPASLGNLRQDNRRQATLTGGYSPVSTASRHQPDVPGPDEDVEWAMDYENRKDDVTRRRRSELRAEKQEVAARGSKGRALSSPHKNRYDAAIVNLENEDPSSRKLALPVEESFQTTLPDDDPRGYFMRRQKSILAQLSKPGGSGKLSRAKSMRMPLETIPNQAQLHKLILKRPTNISSLCSVTKELERVDTWIDRDIQYPGLKLSPLESARVAISIEDVVNKWMKTEQGKYYEVEFEFGNLVDLS